MNSEILKTDTNQLDDTYNLLNIKNYNQHINDSINEITNIFILLLKEYITLFFKKENKNKYIFDSGINILIHIFNITLYYTKNLKLTCYYTQQGYHVYLDFINELNKINISFLNLKTKDAIMFVYKKTIFCICNEYKKNIDENTYNNSDENKLFIHLNKIINIHKTIVLYFSKNILSSFTSEQDIYFFCDNITNFNILISSKKKDEKVFDIFIYFLYILIYKEENNENIDYINKFFTNITFFYNNILKIKYYNQDNISKIKKNIDNLRINKDTQIDNNIIETIIFKTYEI